MATGTFSKVFAILSAVFLASSTSFAEPKYIPRIIPKCKVVQGVGCVYNLKQVKKLYEIDTELEALRVTYTKCALITGLKDEVIEDYREMASLSGKNTKLFRDRNRELTKQLLDLDRKYQYERAKLRIGNPVLWTVVAIVSASFVGYVVSDQVSK